MNTQQKGELAQLRAELRALEKGFVAARPQVVTRYDLLIDDGSKIWRVQVKYADGKAANTDNAVLASLSAVDRHNNTTLYTIKEVDAFVIYVPKVDEVLWLPADIGCGKTKLQIKTGGRRQTNSLWYEDYIW